MANTDISVRGDLWLYPKNQSKENVSDYVNFTLANDVGRTIVLSLTLGTVVLATVFGNALVVFAVTQIRSLRSVTNYFIVSLAVSDLALGIVVLPLSSTYEILGYWVFGHWMCVLWCALDVMCCTASILNLVAISIDRYLAINKPMVYLNMSTARRAFLAIICVWILAILISVPPVFGWRDKRRDLTQCALTSGKGYVIYSACGSFYIPLIVMLYVYSRIYVTAVAQTEKIKRGSNMGSLKKYGYSNKTEIETEPFSWKESTFLYVQRKTSRNSSSSTSHDGSIRDLKKRSQNMGRRLRRFTKEKKAAKTLAIVVGAFVVCWFPFFSCYLLREVCTYCNIPKVVFKFFFWLGYCNSFLNPIIYPCLNRDFRRAFRKILCKPRCNKSDLDYYDTPTRSVKPIRASRRLRMSLVPHSSSSGTPPDSPNVSLLRQQNQMRRMSHLLEANENQGDVSPTLCNVHVDFCDDRDGTFRWNPCSSRTSSCRSRVHGSISEPAIDEAIKQCNNRWFKGPRNTRLSQTSDCLQLLEEDSAAEEFYNRHFWSYQARDSVSADAERIEMLNLPPEAGCLIQNYHAEDEDEHLSPPLLTPASMAHSLNDLLPATSPSRRLSATSRPGGRSWPNVNKCSDYVTKDGSERDDDVRGAFTAGLMTTTLSLPIQTADNTSNNPLFRLESPPVCDTSTQTGSSLLDFVETKESSAQTDRNPPIELKELINRCNNTSWTL